MSRYTNPPVSVRLTEEQAKALSIVAEVLGTSLSAVLRDAALVAVGAGVLATDAGVVREVQRVTDRTAKLAKSVRR